MDCHAPLLDAISLMSGRTYTGQAKKAGTQTRDHNSVKSEPI